MNGTFNGRMLPTRGLEQPPLDRSVRWTVALVRETLHEAHRVAVAAAVPAGLLPGGGAAAAGAAAAAVAPAGRHGARGRCMIRGRRGLRAARGAADAVADASGAAGAADAEGASAVDATGGATAPQKAPPRLRCSVPMAPARRRKELAGDASAPPVMSGSCPLRPSSPIHPSRAPMGAPSELGRDSRRWREDAVVRHGRWPHRVG